MQHRWVSGRNGTEYGYEKRRFIFGVFKVTADQKWSPAMTERQTVYGVKIGPLRFSVSWIRLHWLDGKQPSTELVR